MNRLTEIFHVSDLARNGDSFRVLGSNQPIVAECVLGAVELMNIQQVATYHHACPPLPCLTVHSSHSFFVSP